MDDMSKPMNYFEHDNRAAPDYDDYPRSNYPPVSLPFRNDRYDFPPQQNNHISSQFPLPMVQNDYYSNNNDPYMHRNGYDQPYAGSVQNIPAYGNMNPFQHISNIPMGSNNYNYAPHAFNGEHNGNKFPKFHNDR